ncbi:STAGA complex 65 subunit gamma isoform X1 [Neodiprion pinetum]|uniref:STAGA complex 65 subunit gamma isoform X1 n=1 Tax=Neodiprion lecontei TaxID=441921 RepID=A0ABM3GH18_NEOLC|nr:STAGA complex 65 subunit gamma-like isoform X1 [Neodiprion pinetum]XP_046599530.1 STAGA complex 65 subunit gamma isoform X1 [Neodiprion lecontei]
MKSSKCSTTTAGAHWGELPTKETHKQEIITPDVIENIWRQVMDDTKSSEFDFQTDNQVEYFQLPNINPHVLNTINLHQRLRDLLSQENGGSPGPATEIDGLPLLEVREQMNPFHFSFPHAETETDSKDAKIPDEPPAHPTYLTPETAHGLLRHSVIVLLAHTGFENSSDIAIEAVTDIADQFLKRMTRLLKLAAEQDKCGFPDAVERVLYETGIGGAQSLHDYYQENVLRFEMNMKQTVERAEVERREMELDAGSSRMEQNDGFGGVSFDELDAFGKVCREVPTLQLLDPDLGFPPSLDAGFQMLHSLEQEGLEVEEEEVNVSDSPNSSRQRQSETLSDKRKKV